MQTNFRSGPFMGFPFSLFTEMLILYLDVLISNPYIYYIVEII